MWTDGIKSREKYKFLGNQSVTSRVLGAGTEAVWKETKRLFWGVTQGCEHRAKKPEVYSLAEWRTVSSLNLGPKCFLVSEFVFILWQPIMTRSGEYCTLNRTMSRLWGPVLFRHLTRLDPPNCPSLHFLSTCSVTGAVLGFRDIVPNMKMSGAFCSLTDEVAVDTNSASICNVWRRVYLLR